MDNNSDPARVEEMDDVCALPLVRRLAATLDMDPHRFRVGDPLPRGWHVCLFTVDTRQSLLRPDGAAGLGVTLPDLGLPRLMMGGRRILFSGDIPIGAVVRRESRRTAVIPKEGRSGRFVIVTIQHNVFVQGDQYPVIEEQQDYVMRAAAEPAAATGERPMGETPPQSATPTATRTVVPDETLLFRYSAITFNPHRIHYDFPYATTHEGYPALVVNGGIPSLLLIQLFRTEAGREPKSVAARNVAPLLCGQPMQLNALQEGRRWRMWAQDSNGRLALDASME